MKKQLVVSACALALMGTISSSVFAEAPANPAQGEAVRTATAPTIDGKKDTIWGYAPIHYMEHYSVAVHDNATLDPKKSADDFSGNWQAMWDDQYLYVLLDITDPVRITWNLDNTGGYPHYDDSAQLFVVESVDKEYTTIVAHSSGQIDAFGGPPSWNTTDITKDSMIVAVNDNGKNLIYEFAIPWNKAGVSGIVPALNKEIRFEIQAVDNDLGGEQMSSINTNGKYPQSKLGWNDPENQAYINNEYLGILKLVDAKAEPSPTPSATNNAGSNGSTGTASPTPSASNDTGSTGSTDAAGQTPSPSPSGNTGTVEPTGSAGQTPSPSASDNPSTDVVGQTPSASGNTGSTDATDPTPDVSDNSGSTSDTEEPAKSNSGTIWWIIGGVAVVAVAGGLAYYFVRVKK